MLVVPPELDWVVTVDGQILGGKPCFKGTRVAIQTFLDYVESGVSMERFLAGFPSVKKFQATIVASWFATRIDLTGFTSRGHENLAR